MTTVLMRPRWLLLLRTVLAAALYPVIALRRAWR